MSDDKIKEIHKRHAFADENKSVIRPTGFSWTIPGWQAHNDRAFLLAEVERQRAEIERLRAALKGIDALYPDVPDALGANDLRVIVAQMGDLARNALDGKP